jgi:hypothetical protein
VTPTEAEIDDLQQERAAHFDAINDIDKRLKELREQYARENGFTVYANRS